MSILRPWLALLAVTLACASRGATGADTSAIATATRRVREHGNAGLSIDDVKRTRDWFTPELYTLLIAGMSHPTDLGYLDFDPFTDAQDDVGPLRFEDARQSGDTTLVRFSRENYEKTRDSITLAMRRVDSTWRIANFLYSKHMACHRDLAVAIAGYEKAIAEHRLVDDSTCRSSPVSR